MRKVLDDVDKAGSKADYFRGIVLIGDQQQSEGYSWMHASLKDMETLILDALRNSDEFTLATAKAFEAYYNDQQATKNKTKDENNQI